MFTITTVPSIRVGRDSRVSVTVSVRDSVK